MDSNPVICSAVLKIVNMIELVVNYWKFEEEMSQEQKLIIYFLGNQTSISIIPMEDIIVSITYLFTIKGSIIIIPVCVVHILIMWQNMTSD